jgi:diguanylate cyclase (GGDEF)-like protein
VLAVWALLLVVSVLSGLVNVWLGWNGIPVAVGWLTIDVTVYPPFLIALLLTVWLGPAWGVIPLYFANLASGIAGGLTPGGAAVFSLAAPVEMVILWGSLVLLNVSPELRTVRDAMHFLLVALIAATASSVATPLWNAANHLDLLQGFRVWRGWVVGDFLQCALIGAPILRVLTRGVQASLAGRFPDPPIHPDSHRAAVGFVATLFVMLGVLASLGVVTSVRALMLEPDTRVPSGELLLPQLHQIGFFLGVVFVVLMFTTVVFTWALAHRTTKEHAAARRDTLTGCLNRRAFDEIYEREAVRSRRLGQGLVILFLDIDHFKTVNDRYGHPVGDRVLQHFARGLQGLLRDTDFVFRWGGEEFLILLPHTAPAEGAPMGDRIRERVAEDFVLTRDVREPVRLTVSVGVAATADPPERADALIAQADAAAYRAKEAGRNRVSG